MDRQPRLRADWEAIFHGVGTALVEGLVSKLRAEGVNILRVTTTWMRFDFINVEGFES